MNPNQENLVLRVEKRGDRLQVSCFKQETNHPHPVRNFLEQSLSVSTLKEQTQRIQKVLCRMNQAGELTPEAFRQLKNCGQILYDELFPLAVKERLNSLESLFLTLEIDEDLNFVPWELLFDGEDFLCRRFAMGRIVRTRQVVDTSRFPSRKTQSPLRVLLLYDPKGDLSQGEKEPFLGEAEKLLNNFGNHTEIKIDLKSRHIEKATVRQSLREYDIIHYAGHADYNEKEPEKSGWKLVNGKFIAQDLTKMIGTRKSMPLLIFSNACRSGRVDFTLEQDYQNRVFSLARIFLVSGVRHYIGTFWDILNKESAEFASLFYQNLFAGQSIGEALQRARISFSTASGKQTALWSSYILYGSPSVSYIKSAEQQDHLIHPMGHPELTISPFGPTTIRGALADVEDSPAINTLHERAQKKPSIRVEWAKVARTGALALGFPIMVGVIFLAFHSFREKKLVLFPQLQESFAPLVIAPGKRILHPEESKKITAQFIQAETLIAQGKNLQAQALFSQMIDKGALNLPQQSQAWNRLGRLYAGSDKIVEALDAFQQSIQANPDLYENYTNKAVLLRDRGDWSAAYQSVKKALERNPEDDIAKALEEELMGRLALEKDKTRKQRVDQLVRELSEAYRHRDISPLPVSSKVKTITFLDFSFKGRIPDRLGEAGYLKHTLIQALQKKKEIKIVERVLINRLLEELKLGSSEVADPSVSVRLGRVLAARCIAVGTIYRFETESEITLKLMDTETSEILAVITEKVKDTDSLHRTAGVLADKIAETISRTGFDPAG